MRIESEFITIPKRGLKVLPPPITRDNISRARSGEKVEWSDRQKASIGMLVNCKILAKRYPHKEDGERFMEFVDYAWRLRLYSIAEELTQQIVLKWHQIDANQDIAVLLYGSVAKGLVKKPDHPDPSNIDLAIIGPISDEDREMLFDKIRPLRIEAQGRILGKCPELNTREVNPGNVGVVIQGLEKVTKDNFSTARSYITAGANVLYDPSHIWEPIEQAALDYVVEKQKRKRRI